MITPPYLKTGDKVAIVAPAKKIPAERIENAVQILTGWGLEVSTGKHVLSSYNYFSGTDEQRATDMQEALDDESVKAIFCARGGYGTVRIIDRLNFNRFKESPKWIIGYSDITVLHSHINETLQIETLHAPMPLDYPTEKQDRNPGLLSLKKALFGEPLFYEIKQDELNKKGDAQGFLTGGNLSVIMSLLGSKSEPGFQNKILFIEDVGESMYQLDRMMMTLKRAGKLEKLKGLIVGHLTDFKDNQNTYAFNKTPEQIISDAVGEYEYPVCFGFPAGHDKNSVSLIMGRQVYLNATADKSFVEFAEQNTQKMKKGVFKRILISAISITALFLALYFLYAFIINFFS